MATSRNLTTKTTIQNLIAEQKKVFATISGLSAVESKVTTLIGSDSNKSVRTIANEELAAQLIPASADESLDTLQEIAAWIQSHPGDASAMNSAISALQTKVTLGTHEVDSKQTEYGTVKDYVEAAIAAAVASINSGSLDSRISALEGVGATKTEASTTNGNIKINDVETTVYTLPESVLTESDISDYTAGEIAQLLA